MSTASENEFDLEKLFLPSWAQEPSSAKQYAQYEGREERSFDRRPDHGGRPEKRRPSRPGPRRDENRPRDDRGRLAGGKGPERAPGGEHRGPDRGDRRGPDRGERREHRAPAQPLPELNVN